MNRAQIALMKKDLRAITSNKRLFSVMLIIPLIMVVVLPTVFMLGIAFTPTDSLNLTALQNMLPIGAGADLPRALAEILLNNIVLVFFMLIPVMASSVMAASSFVGEKERNTLETLLYCPLSLRQIFQAKVLASFVLSMAVSLASFVIMIIVVEVEATVLLGGPVFPSMAWAIVMLIISPAISMIAITMTVRGSAKAKTVEESQQRAAFLILPIMLLLASQFTGLLLLSAWLLLALGLVLAGIAALLTRGAFGKFSYESLLQ